MHNSLIKVCYLSTGVFGRDVYFLDTQSGRLWKDSQKHTAQGSGYVRVADGKWRNDAYAVQEVVEPKAPTPDPKSDAVNENNERGAGLKFDSGKPRWTLLMQGCAKALEGVAKVLTFGAKKYVAHSWKQVENNEERYRDALYRHLNAIEGGEAVDPESGLPHWDHVACNALFLSQLNKDKGNV